MTRSARWAARSTAAYDPRHRRRRRRHAGQQPCSAALLSGRSRRPGGRRGVPRLMILAVSEAPDYAFPHSAEDESRRLELLEQRLDPLTKQRIQRLGVGKSARCLEIGGGRGSITRWLSHVVGPTGRVIATDVQIGFLSEIDASNVEVIRHDIRTGTFPPGGWCSRNQTSACGSATPTRRGRPLPSRPRSPSAGLGGV